MKPKQIGILAALSVVTFAIMPIVKDMVVPILAHYFIPAVGALLAIGFIISFITIVILQRFSKNPKYCYFGHWEPTSIKAYGINLVGKCPRCDKDVMQDSQGNWFDSIT